MPAASSFPETSLPHQRNTLHTTPSMTGSDLLPIVAVSSGIIRDKPRFSTPVAKGLKMMPSRISSTTRTIFWGYSKWQIAIWEFPFFYFLFLA
jgi:hypothetical protein